MLKGIIYLRFEAPQMFHRRYLLLSTNAYEKPLMKKHLVAFSIRNFVSQNSRFRRASSDEPVRKRHDAIFPASLFLASRFLPRFTYTPDRNVMQYLSDSSLRKVYIKLRGTKEGILLPKPVIKAKNNSYGLCWPLQ